ncbi:ferredoxin [Streptomyces sp. DSM 15324]|uniref:ferredoxin n=1 Tax=Streptomyces sp. DSM 15324 TaxID=1739111 RepID=UPI00074A1048|nr:ferredoxin [Streptomyces sp. DSM 15324]
MTTAPTATATATATTPASSPAPEELVRFLEDRFACAEASADCARACVLRASALDPEGSEQLRLLRRKAILCAEVCDATCRVLAEDTRVDEAGLRVQLEWCRTICLETAHAFGTRRKRPSPPGAAETAEACRACARACTDFMATLH